MTLQDLGALGELVGGIAIIVSLIYVGLQIRQSTAASRSATAQSFTQQYTEVNQMLIDPDARGVVARGLDGVEKLTVEEKIAFMSVMSSISRTLESFYFQIDEGALDRRLFEGWFVQYLDLLANKGAQEFWKLRKHQYTSEFAEYLDNRMAKHESKPLYDEGGT